MRGTLFFTKAVVPSGIAVDAVAVECHKVAVGYGFGFVNVKFAVAAIVYIEIGVLPFAGTFCHIHGDGVARHCGEHCAGAVGESFAGAIALYRLLVAFVVGYHKSGDISARTGCACRYAVFHRCVRIAFKRCAYRHIFVHYESVVVDRCAVHKHFFQDIVVGRCSYNRKGCAALHLAAGDHLVLAVEYFEGAIGGIGSGDGESVAWSVFGEADKCGRMSVA